MKQLILLTGYRHALHPFTATRPQPLLHLSGSTVLGHLLHLLRDAPAEQVVFVVDAEDAATTAWLRQQTLPWPMEIVAMAGAGSAAEALRAARDHLDETAVLIAPAATLVEADFATLATTAADAVTVVASDDATPCMVWCRRGSDLRQPLTTLRAAKTAADLAAVARALRESGATPDTLTASLSLDVTTPQGLLHANARLLGVGYGSADAIERSYAEDFTVLPPVFIHETAVVENAVIGPFVNVEAEAQVRNSVVRNSLIDAGAKVAQAVLDGAWIGEGAQVNGRWQSPRLAAGETAAES